MPDRCTCCHSLLTQPSQVDLLERDVMHAGCFADETLYPLGHASFKKSLNTFVFLFFSKRGSAVLSDGHV